MRKRAGLLQICLAGVLWGTGGLAVTVIRDHADLSATTISA
jgi:drug/metabolite transporter, DME family